MEKLSSKKSWRDIDFIVDFFVVLFPFFFFGGFSRFNALYIFSLSSDDGSQLFIDDQLVINNDGLHGLLEKNGRIALSKGKHAILITFFNKLGGKGLDVKMAALGGEMKPIHLNKLFHTN